MITVADQLNRKIQIPENPSRIVSLVPSQTELLADLGLDSEVVGVTRFCVHPDDWRFCKTRVGGTKDFKLDRIRELRPDLIIANKEENEKDGIRELEKEFPVWVSDVYDLESTLQMIDNVGGLIGRMNTARALVDDIRMSFKSLALQVKERHPSNQPTAAYLIWNDPMLVAGGDTFISAMIEAGGWRNVFADRVRYPEISSEDLQAVAPDLVFLSSEPYPFREEHVKAMLKIVPQAQIHLVDGEMFSWYGSRLKKTPGYLKALRAKIADHKE